MNLCVPLQEIQALAVLEISSEADKDRGNIMTHYYLEKMVKEKRREMLHQACRQKLISEYEKKVLPGKARFLISLGDMLIRWGKLLKSRYGEEINTQSCSHP